MRRGFAIKIIARKLVIKSLEERLKPINLAFLRPGARRRHDSRHGVCGESIRRGRVQAEPSASRRPQPNNFLRCPCRVERETPRRRGLACVVQAIDGLLALPCRPVACVCRYCLFGLFSPGGCPFLIRCQQFSTVAYPSIGIAPEGLDDEKLGHRHGDL